MTPEEREQAAASALQAREAVPHRLRVCMAASCLSAGSESVRTALVAEVERRGLGERCQITQGGCLRACSVGPLVSAEPEGTLFQNLRPEDAGALVDSLGAEPLPRLVYPRAEPFFSRQVSVVLETSGRIDPESLDDYLALDGYETLLEVVTHRSPAEVIQEVVRSGLRGRGGAGYPTGLKWTSVAKSAAAQRYVVCNADEGDPGAFMDRAVLESDPHRVIEGMAIAAYAVGATRGYIYSRGEYPLAVERARKAIRQAEGAGLLGTGVAGTPFGFHLELRLGGGAFVCGEETALLASIEGRRGTPVPRPPYPAESGLWGAPTLLNNVETFASIPAILRMGGEAYASMGTEHSKGTKVFALAGSVRNTGLIEVPMGITLREIVFEIGGGIPEGRRFKAVQTGGPSGGCIPEAFLDMPVDYESLAEAGSIMGSGGMIVMDDTSCMVDVARFFMDFCVTESCGKCIPCRVGTVHLRDLLQRVCDGTAGETELSRIEDLSDVVKHTSLCGLGQTAPNPVLSTLRHFRHEYLAHVVDHVCPAGVCSAGGRA